MARIEARLDKSDLLLDDLTKYAKRSLDKIYRLSETKVPMKTHNQHTEEPEDLEKPQMMYNGKKLLDQGGATPVDKAYNIAKALWTTEETVRICIDPNRRLSKVYDREPADEERTKLYRDAVEEVFGDIFSEKLYRRSLRLVNQRMREKRTKSLDA